MHVGRCGHAFPFAGLDQEAKVARKLGNLALQNLRERKQERRGELADVAEEAEGAEEPEQVPVASSSSLPDPKPSPESLVGTTRVLNRKELLRILHDAERTSTLSTHRLSACWLQYPYSHAFSSLQRWSRCDRRPWRPVFRPHGLRLAWWDIPTSARGPSCTLDAPHHTRKYPRLPTSQFVD